MKKRFYLMVAMLLGTVILFTGCEEKKDFTVNLEGIEKVDPTAEAAVHDPSIIQKDGEYYIFGSHMSAAKSIDLKNWEMLTNGYSQKNKVYTDVAQYDSGEFAFTGNKVSTIPTADGYAVWAPDVVYNKKNNKYYLYGCTSSTFNASTIYYSVSDNIEGPYVWQGNLIYSGFNKENITSTDVLDYVDEETAIDEYTTKAGYEYNYKEYPNAIDPTVFYDKEGKMWMVYGSWSGGIFILEIDEETGKVIRPVNQEGADAYFGKRLLGGGHNSIEGPYIVYDEEADYYYMFVSYGELKRDGGYQIRVFRSKEPDGTYEDMNGAFPDVGMAHGFYGLKLSGNYLLPSLKYGYKATGHNSALIDEDGKKYVAYHTRFDKGSEQHTPKVKQYFLNEQLWPCLLPYTTNGEQISKEGYEKDEIIGRYYFINQGTSIDDEVITPVILYLDKDGTVVGENAEGKWSYTKGTYYMSIQYEDKEYNGVFCKMTDEFGTEVMTFSAVGSNESVWGVKY